MKISELQKIITRFKHKHGDLEVIYNRYSDYCCMDPEDVTVVRALQQSNDDWVQRHHESMSPEDQAKVKLFLHFPGN